MQLYVAVNFEINSYMFQKRPSKSLEDTIRDVRNKYKNRPSPIAHLSENVWFTPTQQAPTSSPNMRDKLLGGFKPLKDTFR